MVLGNAGNIDVLHNYGPGKQYIADTKMATLITGTAAKKGLLARANEDFRDSFLDEWTDFAAKDIDDCETISDFISAVCQHCPIKSPPQGEPT